MEVCKGNTSTKKEVAQSMLKIFVLWWLRVTFRTTNAGSGGE